MAVKSAGFENQNNGHQSVKHLFGNVASPVLVILIMDIDECECYDLKFKTTRSVVNMFDQSLFF
jgi:hypothetical protein